MLTWRSIPQGNVPDGFVCLPFMHVGSGSVEFLPVTMLSKMYTSNGMATGNTIDEACVQALSEIYERYATIQILSRKITPPNIPCSEIAQNRRLHNMIQTVEQRQV